MRTIPPLSHEFAELLNDSDGEITGGKTRFVSVRFERGRNRRRLFAAEKRKVR